MGELYVPVSIESIQADIFPDVALFLPWTIWRGTRFLQFANQLKIYIRYFNESWEGEVAP